MIKLNKADFEERLAKAKPITFGPEMVKAIKADRKEQTRRPIKGATGLFWDDPEWTPYFEDGIHFDSWWKKDGSGCISPGNGAPNPKCPYGKPGDLLWVKESLVEMSGDRTRAWYDADHKVAGYGWPWKLAKLPARYMPKRAARTLLEIVTIRVERVQEISTEDIRAEGVAPWVQGPKTEHSYREAFQSTWQSMYAGTEKDWNQNPWVWAITFRAFEAKGGSE